MKTRVELSSNLVFESTDTGKVNVHFGEETLTLNAEDLLDACMKVIGPPPPGVHIVAGPIAGGPMRSHKNGTEPGMVAFHAVIAPGETKLVEGEFLYNITSRDGKILDKFRTKLCQKPFRASSFEGFPSGLMLTSFCVGVSEQFIRGEGAPAEQLNGANLVFDDCFPGILLTLRVRNDAKEPVTMNATLHGSNLSSNLT